MLVAIGSTALIYVFLIATLRVLGRRQLGQLTVIDLVVVLVLGSAVETSMIHGDTSLRVGIASAVTLLVLNRLLTVLFLHHRRLRHLVNGGPILLVNQGHIIDEHLRRAGITNADLLEALRAQGYDRLPDVRAAVLETDGAISVIPVRR